jgi:RNA polymerase sigma-70 factor (ECF subfamily)
VAALTRGEPDAVGLLIGRYQAMVFGLAQRMLGNRHDAEDVVQETFLRAVRSIRGFDGSRSLRPWILGIAANRCRTSLGRRARRPALEESVEQIADRFRPEHEANELAQELARALERLRPEYRLVFVLFHEQGMAYEEIGQSIGRPVGTVKTWIHRARLELAEMLAKRGVVSESTFPRSGDKNST